MDKIKLSRRKVLSGIAVAGGSGSLVGAGTGALFTDEEIFTSNTVQASTNIGGVVDLDATLEELADPNNEGVRYSISLPDDGSSTTTNNPAYIWLRTLQCPEPGNLAEDVDITVTVSYDGGDTETQIHPGSGSASVLDVLNEFRTGIHVGQDADDFCMQPGDDWFVDFEVTDASTDEQITFELEYYAQQCRYQTGPTNPWDEGDFTSSCGNDSNGGNAISFIAFCGPSGMDPTVDISGTDSDGEPISVDWDTNSDVTYVSMKAGNNWTIYDYRDQTKTSGTVESGGDPDAAFFGSINPQGGTASDPCEVAAERAGESDGFDGESVKFEYNGDEFRTESYDE